MKNKNPNHKITATIAGKQHQCDVQQDLVCTTFDFTLHRLCCACAFQVHKTEQGLLKKITHLEQNHKTSQNPRPNPLHFYQKKQTIGSGQEENKGIYKKQKGKKLYHQHSKKEAGINKNNFTAETSAYASLTV